jgi:pimeloyl-ACP methyl ester carboxylesterase
MLGRILIALLALVGLAVVAGVAGYFVLKRPDIPYETLAAQYETPASRYETLPDGVKLHYLDEGNPNGPVIVLLHGFTASAHSWDQWAARLGDRYHLIAIDLPGHGLTSTPADYQGSTEAFRDTLAAFVRARGLQRFALVGNSLGGRVAWTYALAFPDHVEALVLVDAAGWPDPRMDAIIQSPMYQALQSPLVGPVLRDLDNTKLVRQGLEAAFVNDALVTDSMVQSYVDFSRAPGHRSVLMSLQQELPTQTYATPETLAALRMPTLILWGEHDELVPPAHAEQFRDAIQNSQLTMFPDIGHIPQEEAPDESAMRVRAFLSEFMTPPAPQPAPLSSSASTAPPVPVTPVPVEVVEPPSP